ncbi:MAG TPA: hypothetical protein DCL77_01735 [Prolixibacteraceae bacterium]|jgi:hypothetical protein|nr:hypothetical protein [Prolixibacteraceae bacterium]
MSKFVDNGNILIARFMSEEPEVLEHDLKRDSKLFLGYDADWLWLMPVVEKIEATKFNDCWTVVAMGLSQCEIYNKKFDGFRIFKITDTKIEATWLACVEFIKWYNKQNKV